MGNKNLNHNTRKIVGQILCAIFFVAAGTLHFFRTTMYLQIMPSWCPFSLPIVLLTGVFEIIGGIGLIIPAVRFAAGCGLIVLLIAVFPANIHMALNSVLFPTFPAILLWLRLPLQFVFIAWVWWCIKGDKQDNVSTENVTND